MKMKSVLGLMDSIELAACLSHYFVTNLYN